ncbi:hypothetical protein GCM10009712_33690 [Pseudarthrobacter sulfonivorans]|nr:hypothetical protein [Pseudarthrobacter sulfonivorans]
MPKLVGKDRRTLFWAQPGTNLDPALREIRKATRQPVLGIRDVDPEAVPARHF